MVKYVLKYAILFFLLFYSLKADAKYVFRTFDVSDGLPENTVRCIEQDEQGFIWLGTFNGLCRFDGVGFRTYRHDPQVYSSLADNTVSSLVTVRGGLWVGTARGLDFFSTVPQRQVFISWTGSKESS